MSIQKRTRICLLCSAAIVLVALLMTLFGAGLNLGMDYVGSYLLSYDMKEVTIEADVAAALRAEGVSDYRIAFSLENAQIRVPNMEDSAAQNLKDSLQKHLNAETATATYMGPTADGVVARNALLCGLIAAAILFIGMAVRYEAKIRWDVKPALAALFGLAHDVLLVLSLSILLRLIVDTSFVYAMLVVVGFSISNLIVHFDHLYTDSKNKEYSELTQAELVSASKKNGLGRMIDLGVASLIIVGALFIVGVSGVKHFALPLLLGVIVSAYSACFLTGYVWAFLEGKGSKNASVRGKAKAKKA